MRTLILLLALAIPALHAAEIKVPAEIRAKAGRLKQAEATSDDKARIRWINGHADLDVIGADNGRLGIISSPRPGKYLIHLHSDAGGDPVPVTVIVEAEAPTPPPQPPPNPDDPPVPTPPAPAPTGPLRILILYESEDLPRMPPAQVDALYSRAVEDKLNAICAPDGRVKAWRKWDKDTDASKASKAWQDALSRAKRPARTRATAGVPKVVAFRSEEWAGEWPLPSDVPAMLALLDKIAGGAAR